MVEITKRALKIAVGRRAITADELHTLLTEAETVVNSRPLTPIIEDGSRVLRPIDFLLPHGTALTGIPRIADPESHDSSDPPFIPAEDSVEQVLKTWNSITSRINRFWDLWREDYLAVLRDRLQVNHIQKRSLERREPRENEVVLIIEDTAPRGTWQLGIIEKVHNEASQVRSATVRLPSGNLVKRPISRLAPLEISASRKQTTIASPADANLEAESPEETESLPPLSHKTSPRPLELIQPIATRRRARRTAAHAVPFYFLCLLTFSLLGGSSKARIRNVQLTIPPSQNCTQDVKGPLQIATVSVYEQTYVKAPAQACFEIRRELCTRAFLRLSLKVVKDEWSAHALKAQECKQMFEHKSVKGMPLHSVTNNSWKTSRPTTYSYGFFGKRCTTTSNFELDTGEVATMDGLSLVSGLGDLEGCCPLSGKCIRRSKIIIWDPSVLMRCRWAKVGTYVAHISNNRVMINDLQTSFVPIGMEMNNGSSQNCSLQTPVRTVNDFVLTINDWTPEQIQKWVNGSDRKRELSQRTKDISLPDQENAKLQFTFDVWRQEFERHVSANAKLQCQTNNRFLLLAKGLAEANPSLAAQILLKRTDVQAKWKDGRLWVSPRKIEIEKETEDLYLPEVIFDSRALRSPELNEIHMKLDMSRTRIERWGTSALEENTKVTAIDDVEEEANLLAKEADLAVERIDEIFDNIVLHWRLVTAGAITIGGVAVILVIVCRCQIKCYQRTPEPSVSYRVNVPKSEKEVEPLKELTFVPVAKRTAQNHHSTAKSIITQR